MRTRLNLALVALVTGIVSYFSFVYIPPGPAAAGINVLDALHVIAYAALAFALLLYFLDTGHAHTEAVILAIAAGIGIEIIQFAIPYRAITVRDVLLNAAGASLILVDRGGMLSTRALALEEKVLRALRIGI